MIYLDACVAIYAVEKRDDLGARIREMLRVEADTIAISPLVVHECLVVPLRSRDTEMQSRFHDFFEGLAMIDLDLPAFLRAAELRAGAPGLRTPDSLHLAAAQLGGCRELWTNDQRLATVSRGLAVDVVG